MRKVFIMRGLPGSGKTTWLARTWPHITVCSADFYCMQGGVYRWDPLHAAENHNKCLRRFLTFLTDAAGPELAVDNTNVRAWELAPYYRLAEAFGCDVQIVWCHAHPVLCAQRNVHGLPPSKVQDMAVSFEPLPPWWKVRHVYGVNVAEAP